MRRENLKIKRKNINKMNKKRCFYLFLSCILVAGFLVVVKTIQSAGTPDVPVNVAYSNIQVCTVNATEGNRSKVTINWVNSSLNNAVQYGGIINPATTQTKFQVMVDDDSAFGSPVVSTGTIASGVPSYTTNDYVLFPSTVYHWKVAVYDNLGSWTGWACEEDTITTTAIPNTPTLVSPLNGVNTYTLFPVSPITPILDWNDFSDPDVGDTQIAYRLQIDNNSDFSSPVIDNILTLSTSLYSVPAATLVYNTTYYWRVRVQDQRELWSNWGNNGGAPVNSFITPLHAPPAASFAYIPSRPSKEETIQFTDTSVSFGGSSIVSWAWNFGDGVGTSNLQSPQYVYASQGNMVVALTVTDSDGYQNTYTATLGISVALPVFQEVIPR